MSTPAGIVSTWVSEYSWLVSTWVSEYSWLVSTWVSEYSWIGSTWVSEYSWIGSTWVSEYSWIGSTCVGEYSWIVSTPHSVPSSTHFPFPLRSLPTNVVLDVVYIYGIHRRKMASNHTKSPGTAAKVVFDYTKYTHLTTHVHMNITYKYACRPRTH